MIETFTISTFKEGDIFKLFYGERQFVLLTLAKISEGRYKIPNSPRRGFSLLFKGSKDFFVEQGIHEMYHEKIGEFEMFLVPVVPPYGENDFNLYEAVFN